MILVDTSIWIDLLSRKPKFSISSEGLGLVATSGPILQEVLQGVKSDLQHRQVRDAMLSFFTLPVVEGDYLEASELYRLGRRKGFSIRSSIDALIAAIAIRSKVPVWSNDRDYANLSRFSALRLHEKLTL